ncbi:interferon-related developmental regulator 2 [Galendromus occidentalis]|uniref:Interferon-related developmental regulator 2 n=1 Tax=Galendromus occidentalis TaxID=34638 RepID=A0AAJ6QUZ0_9ACAR|nr:interferon-related developmental regulator 2 [Galendromus occidentalis]
MEIVLPRRAFKKHKARLDKKNKKGKGRLDEDGYNEDPRRRIDESNSICSMDDFLHEDDDESLDDADYEDRLKENLDGATESKSSPKRFQHLIALSRDLADKYCPDFLINRPATMTDLVEKSLKKGKSEEQGAAAHLTSVLALQFGVSPEGTELLRTVHKLLITGMHNASIPAAARTKMATALGVTTYISEDDPFNILQAMEQLKAVFVGSCPKSDGIMPNVPAAESAVHQAAIQAWGLLLTVAEDHSLALIDKNLSVLSCLLHASDVDVRIASGEVLATMYEIAREHDSGFEGDDLDGLCEDLQMLATDSQKFRAKKDRKVQRSSFRDIVKAVRDGEGPDFRIQIGVETLQVITWEEKRLYDIVCGILGSGMSHHLQYNPEVRSLFGLGAPLVVNKDSDEPEKPSKFERNVGNILRGKIHTKRMAKCRDKRLDLM